MAPDANDSNRSHTVLIFSLTTIWKRLFEGADAVMHHAVVGFVCYYSPRNLDAGIFVVIV
jgi:hypothetical protein